MESYFGGRGWTKQEAHIPNEIVFAKPVGLPPIKAGRNPRPQFKRNFLGVETICIARLYLQSSRPYKEGPPIKTYLKGEHLGLKE
jgi:hypothetical protein